jgi:MFS family permease
MASGALSRYAAAFRHRDYRLLVVAFFVDSIGGWAASVVLAVVVFDRTHSLALLAALGAARWVPGLLLAPFGGLVADRYDRRSVMAVAAVGSGVVAIGQTVVIATEAPVLLLLAVQVAGAFTNAPYRPAAGALTPAVVDEQSLAAANGFFAALENLVVVIGPAVGGLLLLLHAPILGLALNAASYFVAAALAYSLRVRSRGTAERGQGLLRPLLSGVRALREAPTAGVLLLFLTLDTALAGTASVVFIPISEHLGTGSGGYGYLLAGSALGGVLGAAVADRASASRRLAAIIVGGLLAESLPFAFTAFTTSPVLGTLLQVVSGIGMVFVDVLALTALQREVTSGQLSRVLGLMDTIGLLATVVGSFGASVLFSAVPYAAALLVLGLGVAAVALLLAPLVVRTDRRTARTAELLSGRVEVLAGLELFDGAGRPVLERLAAAITVEELAPGTVLIREGDPADALWVLADGVLAVSATTQRVTIPDVTAPDVVGEIGVLRGVRRTATVTAETAATLWRLAADDYVQAVSAERLPLIGLDTVSARLRRTHPQLVSPTTAT